jgi:hypothetical protein
MRNPLDPHRFIDKVTISLHTYMSFLRDCEIAVVVH